MQIDPNKPTLKATRSVRLKLIFSKLLSSIAFKFNLRRYNTDVNAKDIFEAGWCSFTLSNPS